jgi:hypothetical protein
MAIRYTASWSFVINELVQLPDAPHIDLSDDEVLLLMLSLIHCHEGLLLLLGMMKIPSRSLIASFGGTPNRYIG